MSEKGSKSQDDVDELTPCEFCGKNEFMMIDFNCLLPSFGVIVRGDICIQCFEGVGEDDVAVAVELVKKRAEAAGVELPAEWPVLERFIKRPVKDNGEDRE